jgi:GAF domain-containing protein
MQYFGVVLPANFGGTAGVITTIGVVLILLTNYRNRTETLRLDEIRKINQELKDLSGTLEQRVNARTSELLIANQQVEKRAGQLQLIAEVARSVATIQETDQLLSTITKLVSEQFGFYHVGIFLIDAKAEFANLHAANSDGGIKMLARGHRLKVGEQGIVGLVASRGVARIALDVGEEAVFFNNPDLPDTHSEVALPLNFGREIIGVLDIQSKDINAFSQDAVNIFSVLADQVSVAIQNTRSLETVQRALHEAEIASSQLTGQAWKGYTKTIQAKGYRYDGIKSEALKEASAAQSQKDALTIPVQLRGQTIGRLKIKGSDSTRKWTDDERAIIESTAERVAIAMEGARLLDEAQKRAARETFLSEIGSKLGASFQLDSILRDTVEELGHNLQGSTVSFQLVNPSAPLIEQNDEHDEQ